MMRRTTRCVFRNSSKSGHRRELQVSNDVTQVVGRIGPPGSEDDHNLVFGNAKSETKIRRGVSG